MALRPESGAACATPAGAASAPTTAATPTSPLAEIRPMRARQPNEAARGAGVGCLAADGLLPTRQDPVGPRVVAGVAVGVALQVVLVLGLGLPERAGRLDLGHDLA